MLEQILGSKTAAKALLYLIHFGEAYASGISTDMSISLSQIQRQLDRFESAGVLVSKKVGQTRMYQFNPKSPAARSIKDLVTLIYNSQSISQKEAMFQARRRPRRQGKPVISAKVVK